MKDTEAETKAKVKELKENRIRIQGDETDGEYIARLYEAWQKAKNGEPGYHLEPWHTTILDETSQLSSYRVAYKGQTIK